MSNVELTKEEIFRNEAVSAAQKLFQQYGLYKTTIEDIAKAMGRGKSTLYYYYKSKEEIFEAVIKKEILNTMELIKKAIDKEDTAEKKLITYFATANEVIKNMINLYRVIIVSGELADYPSFLNQLRKKHDAQEIQLIKDILILGIKNNEFISKLELEVDHVSYLIANAHRSLMVDLVIDDKFSNWNDNLSIMLEILVRGLRK
ncbi:MAG: hypothetical protein A2X12_00815 [Bacteroidetes bacterium GWE2_29_8]|nr:MAG: hypothetical protein A2X12_00815 [Bacteroidetes bacterium GWE2_29_8]